MINVSEWYGRLGNNLIQLQNVIKIALFFKYRVHLPKHSLIDVKFINNYFSLNKNNQIMYKQSSKINFYKRNEIYAKLKINSEVFEKNEKESLDIIKKAFIIKDIDKLGENTIVIHIRSGDIFNTNPHPKYYPPPLSYYVNILRNNNFNQIIIVSEDEKNPVVNKLLKLYPYSTYNKNNLKDDIKIILGATNIIESVGTFIPNLMLLSTNIKNIFSTSTYKKELQKYYNYPWKNTSKQRYDIINFKMPTR